MPYVLVHGAWQNGGSLALLREALMQMNVDTYTPTLAGNQPEATSASLASDVASLATYIEEQDFNDIVLVGHSYGGMVIAHLAEQMPERIKRLVFWNALVPLPGESMLDLLSPATARNFHRLAEQSTDGTIALPFATFREAFMNDADLITAQQAYQQLARQYFQPFVDGAALHRFPKVAIAKSYLNARQDTAMPHSLPWHPRLSERLGLFRLVEIEGGHMVHLSQPQALAKKILQAGQP